MSLYELILKRRTIRKYQQKDIDEETLRSLINAARHAPSANNLQPLKYIIVTDRPKVDEIYRSSRWAGYIAPYGTPSENEKPAAFIVVLVDTELRNNWYEHDIGAAVQNILLAACEKGIGTCWMGAIDRDKIRSLLNVPEKYIIDTVIALGYPAEASVAEEENGSIKYYKDENGVLHVPKRKLDDIIVKFD